MRQSVISTLSYDFKKAKALKSHINIIYNSITGLTGGFGQSVLILSPCIIFEPYKPRHYRIELELFDLLDQNNYFNRSVTALYLEDRRSTATGRTLFIRLSWYPGVLNKKKDTPK